MKPTLFTIFNIAVPSYLFFLVTSFIVGWAIATHDARKRGLKTGTVRDLAIVVFLGAMLGTNIYAVIMQLLDSRYSHAYFHDFQAFTELVMLDSGLVANGGIIGGLLAAMVYGLVKRESLGKYSNIFALPLASGIVFARIGCFLAGCCHGKACDTGAFCFIFPEESPAGVFATEMSAAGVFPSQLLAALNGFLILLALFFLRRHLKRNWQLLNAFVFLYCVSRIIVDSTRHFPPSERLFGLSHNQVLSLGVLLFLALHCAIVRLVRSDSDNGQAGALEASAGMGTAKHFPPVGGTAFVVLLLGVGLSASQLAISGVNEYKSTGRLSTNLLCRIVVPSKHDAVLYLRRITDGRIFRVWLDSGKGTVYRGIYDFVSYRSRAKNESGEWILRTKRPASHYPFDLRKKAEDTLRVGPPLNIVTQLFFRGTDSLWMAGSRCEDARGHEYEIKQTKPTELDIPEMWVVKTAFTEFLPSEICTNTHKPAGYVQFVWSEGDTLIVTPSVPEEMPFRHNVLPVSHTANQGNLGSACLTLNGGT